MFVAKLDRTRWKLKDAFHHAGCALHRYFERELGQRVPRKTKSAELIDEFDDHYQQLGEDDVLLALRDGDLIATGRYSSEQNPDWPEQEPKWIFHSGAPQPINPAEWRSGILSWDKWEGAILRLKEGEYVDVTVPTFFAQAIWPLGEPFQKSNSQAENYTTPYLELIKAAIAEFQITESEQSKKECLVDWFKEQQVEGEPVSDNLAKAMATIMRLPASQRGGGKRSW